MKQRLRFPFRRLAGLLLIPGAVLSFLPDAARGTTAPMHRIDLLIQGGKGGFRGGDAINRTGNKQRIQLNFRRLGRFKVRVQNEGEVAEMFKMRGSRGDRNFRVRYFLGSANVTNEFLKGTHLTALLQPMTTMAPNFTVRIQARRKAQGTGKTRKIRVKGLSTFAPQIDGTDVVEAILRTR